MADRYRPMLIVHLKWLHKHLPANDELRTIIERDYAEDLAHHNGVRIFLPLFAHCGIIPQRLADTSCPTYSHLRFEDLTASIAADAPGPLQDTGAPSTTGEPSFIATTRPVPQQLEPHPDTRGSLFEYAAARSFQMLPEGAGVSPEVYSHITAMFRPDAAERDRARVLDGIKKEQTYGQPLKLLNDREHDELQNWPEQASGVNAVAAQNAEHIGYDDIKLLAANSLQPLSCKLVIHYMELLQNYASSTQKNLAILPSRIEFTGDAPGLLHAQGTEVQNIASATVDCFHAIIMPIEYIDRWTVVVLTSSELLIAGTRRNFDTETSYQAVTAWFANRGVDITSRERVVIGGLQSIEEASAILTCYNTAKYVRNMTANQNIPLNSSHVGIEEIVAIKNWVALTIKRGVSGVPVLLHRMDSSDDVLSREANNRAG